jgi:RNA polymerase-binding transcription factor DksA
MAKAAKSKKASSKKESAKSKKVLKKNKSSVKTVKKKEIMAKKSTPEKKSVAKKKISATKKAAPKKAVKKTAVVKKPRKEIARIPEVKTPVETKLRTIESIKGYSKKDLEHFREIILAKRDEIIEQLQNLKDQMLDPTTGEYINENSPYSLHMAEQGTDAMEREKTFLYAQRENKFLGYLEDALKRIDAGTYGICIECIEEPQNLCETCPLVPKARLEAVPHSQLCLPIKQRQEKK